MMLIEGGDALIQARVGNEVRGLVCTLRGQIVRPKGPEIKRNTPGITWTFSSHDPVLGSGRLVHFVRPS
jgi:hypothetical protein